MLHSLMQTLIFALDFCFADELGTDIRAGVWRPEAFQPRITSRPRLSDHHVTDGGRRKTDIDNHRLRSPHLLLWVSTRALMRGRMVPPPLAGRPIHYFTDGIRRLVILFDY
jgi:hypothetical protein